MVPKFTDWKSFMNNAAAAYEDAKRLEAGGPGEVLIAVTMHPDVATHPLLPVFLNAIEQAAFGKGERHGGARVDFLQQQWVSLAKSHGTGFLTGQAAKKINEAAESKAGDPYVSELLGALVYTGMAILAERRVVDIEDNPFA